METNTYRIHAFWDAEAAVWVATSDDVPGLVTEAEGFLAYQVTNHDSRTSDTQLVQRQILILG